LQIIAKNAASRIGEQEVAESMAKELAEWIARGGTEEDEDD